MKASKFYTIDTSNAFAALDLSDDGDSRILPSTAAPVKVEETPAPAPVRDSPRPNRGGNRGGRGRGGNEPRGDRNDMRDTRGPAPDGEEGVDNRGGRGGNRGGNPSRRGGRDFPAPRGGKRVFDRKTNPTGMKKPEDTNPEHETEDTIAGEAIAAYDARTDTPQSSKPVDIQDPKISVEAYLASVQAQSVGNNVGASASSVNHESLNKDMVDSGYSKLEHKEVVSGKIPGSTKLPAKSRAEKDRATVHLFEAVPMPPLDLGNNRNQGRNDRRGPRPDNRNQQQNDARPTNDPRADPRVPAVPATTKVKPLKDDAEYPTLG